MSTCQSCHHKDRATWICHEDLLESVDGQPGHGVVGGVVLGLADGLHPAGLVLDVHVVEGHVDQVNAGERTDVIIRLLEVKGRVHY